MNYKRNYLKDPKPDGTNRYRIVEITDEDGETRKVMKPRDRSKYTPGGPKDRGTR